MPKVYRFKKYDIGTDETITSKRWATREAIERLLGKEARNSRAYRSRGRRLRSR